MPDVLSLLDRKRLDWSRSLTDVLDQNHYKAKDIFAIAIGEWQWIATAARLPQEALDNDFDALKTLCWKRLSERERLQASDPLEGLPR